jgi:hypothetical protein
MPIMSQPQSRIVLLLLPVVMILSGCPPPPTYMTITDLSDHTSPSFCISRRPNCSGAGTKMPFFIVAAVDEEGKYANANGLIQRMWVIQPNKDVALKEFRYGTTPEKWLEVQPSLPLTLDTWYRAGHHFFRLYEIDSRVQGEILQYEEYWEKRNRFGVQIPLPERANQS